MSHSPPEWYLRIEAVNLDYSVFDTNDISTIRGGSSLLLDVVSTLSDQPQFTALEKISVGASTGLYRIAANGNEIKAITQAVKDHFQKEPYSYFAVFVIATAIRKQGESLSDLNNRLIAECALQQYQTPSFSFPSPDVTKEQCDFDGVRPAVEAIKAKDKKASRAVYIRREKGRELRKSLYSRCSADNPQDIELPDHLEELAGNEDIALIHFDGNRFGNIRDDCFSEGDYREFDRLVQGIQEKAICDILKHAPKAGGKIRFETLLWGGDEIELVIPASYAWKTLKLFFNAASTDPFRTQTGKQFNLTWSAGMVFCRHNLPILQVRRYANNLCSLAKGKLSGTPETFSDSDNRSAYLNMSSFDSIDRDIGFFISTYHQPASTEDFIFTKNEIDQVHNAMMTIIRLFPKNKVYEIVNKLQKGEPADKVQERAMSMVESSVRLVLDEAVQKIVAGQMRRWMLIGDLWNIIGKQSI
jgi:hypothetical protein